MTGLRVGLALLACAIGARAQGPLPGKVIDVVAGNYFFQAPDTIPAGLTTFRLRTRQGGHGAWILKIGAGHRASELTEPRWQDDVPPWTTNLSGPGFPSDTGSANATLILEPGEYALICYVRSDGKGAPHNQLGMLHRLVVKSSPRTPGQLPRPDVTVRIADTEFRFSGPLRPGRQVIRVINEGQKKHEFKLLHVLPGHTAKESLSWTPESGAPLPDEDFMAIATLSAGGEMTTTVVLQAGEYTVFGGPQADAIKAAIRVIPRPTK